MLEREFHTRLDLIKKDEKKQSELNDKFISLRLLVFIIGVVLSGIFFYKKYITPAQITFAVMIVTFIIVVIEHNNVKKGLKRSQLLIGFYEDCLKRISGEWINFTDTGCEFLSSDHPYSADLNVFGPKSLFQLVNITNTFKGRQRLAELLGTPDRDKAKIIKRQGAIKELSSKLDFIEELTLRGLFHKKSAKDPSPFLHEINENHKVPAVLYNPVLVCCLPAITIISAAFSGRAYPWLYYVVLAGILLQLVLFTWSRKALSPVLGTVHKYKNELESYQKLIEFIEEEVFEDEFLKELQIKFSKVKKASVEIKKLVNLSDYIDFKYSPLVYFVLNALFLWDIHLYRILKNWKSRNAIKIEEWLMTLGEYEALVSLSQIAMTSPVYAYPEIIDEGPVLFARQLAHPFIFHGKRVANDIDLKGTSIITGSNMSGKTTLLRAVGVNLVLAYTGAPVCAISMRTSIMGLFTSMRNIDDLSDGVSTFYAELLRIKEIVDYSRKEKDMIFLVDEIFKGTNSKDRIDGAKIVLKGLNKPWTIGLISTHDYELCELEFDDKRFSNYHFTENYHNNQIHFDYKLHAGRCKTSNARFLMKMVGLDT